MKSYKRRRVHPLAIMHCYFSKNEFEDILCLLALGMKNPREEDWFWW
jgi:hypothetical protein